ncbi:MAG: CRTAC1 family protein [Deltaproteobacteria bacterium]
MRGIALLILAVLVLIGAALAWFWGRVPWPGRLNSPSSTVPEPRASQGPLPGAGGEAIDGASPAPRGPIHFTDVTRDSGIDFVHVSGDSPEKPFPAANGSGVAAFDFDLDGNVDLYFLTGVPLPVDPNRSAPVNRCYRNLGEWRFQDVTSQSGLGDNGYSAGVAAGDYDGDGFRDVFINGFGPHHLYRNQGDGTFVETGSEAGVDDDHWGTSAAFIDYDGDGLLDLYSCHYALWSLETNHFCGDRERGIRIFCNPTSVEPVVHALFHNEGDGRFRNATLEAGVGEARGRGQGVVAADVDGDGRVDLFVANDLSGNFLFLNAGDGKFRDVSSESGTACDYLGRAQAGMGVDAADANHDGRLDLFVTTFEGEHDAYYENLGSALFQDVSRSHGLAAESTPWVGWGTAMADFDLDGWPDIVVTNGQTDPNLRDMGRDSPYENPPILWRNVRGRFSSLARAAAGDYFNGRHAGRGLAVADFDNDGDLDLVITHQDARPALLRNDCLPASSRRSIRVQLIGTTSNRDAIGAELRLTIGNGEVIVQQVKGGGSYLSAHDLRQIIAIPPTETAEKLEIRWPCGKRGECLSLESGRLQQIIER